MTAFLDITSGVKSALQAAPALAGVTVQRGRMRPLPQGAATDVCVNAVRSVGKALDVSGASVKWETTVTVMLRRRVPAGVDAEADVDPWLQALWAALVDMAPPTGVFGIAVEPLVDWHLDEADQTLISVALVLRINHYTTGAALVAA